MPTLLSRPGIDATLFDMQIVQWIQQPHTGPEVVARTLAMSNPEQLASLDDPLGKLTTLGDWKEWTPREAELVLGLWHHHVAGKKEKDAPR